MIERVMAAAATLVVPVALRALPLRSTLALCDAWPRTPGPRASARVLTHRVDRWMAKGRSLWRPTCLTRTLVLYTMLRQHGYRPRLHIGAAGSPRGFRAHAWISLGEATLGERESSLEGYHELLTHDA